TDSVFVAFRSTRYNFAINGVLMGSLKVALPVGVCRPSARSARAGRPSLRPPPRSRGAGR
ncbi:hypothetical protein, partial [Streptomyces zhihengii]